MADDRRCPQVSGKLKSLQGRFPTIDPMELHGHTEEIRNVAFSNSGDSLLSGSRDGTARIWASRGSFAKTTQTVLRPTPIASYESALEG